jgi:Ca2+-binding RTX toxin-like protein
MLIFILGGKGNDTYLLDNINETAITEFKDEGIDSIKLGVNTDGNYQRPNYIENLTLTGLGRINVTGNSSDNVIVGNMKANLLKGGAGADTLLGGVRRGYGR